MQKLNANQLVEFATTNFEALKAGFHNKSGYVEFLTPAGQKHPVLWTVTETALVAHTLHVGPLEVFTPAYNNFTAHGLVAVEVN
jgi:hypothetical protein